MNRTKSAIASMIFAACIGLAGQVSAANQGEFDAGQFKLDMILAQRGDPDAQYYVGKAYEQGIGTHKDMKQALLWYSKAAQQNQYKAQYKLGNLYEYGTGVKQDIRRAMEWYKLAAKNSRSQVVDQMNHQAFVHRQEAMKRRLSTMNAEKQKRERDRKLAQERDRKLAQERARQEKALRQQQLAAARRRAAIEATRKQVAVARVNIPDISDIILKNKWRTGTESADYLPSSSTHCLRSSGEQIVCFSDQKQRVIGGQRVTYTTKATLTGFRPNGTFHIKYNYNATNLAKAAKRGLPADPNGLKLVKGWQEPPMQMNCRTTDRINLYCAVGNSKLHFHH